MLMFPVYLLVYHLGSVHQCTVLLGSDSVADFQLFSACEDCRPMLEIMKCIIGGADPF